MTFDELLNAQPLLRELQDKLLLKGGTRIELLHDDHDGVPDYTMNVLELPAILHEGAPIDLPVHEEFIAHNQCHANARKLFMEGKDTAIGTGFALDADDYWYHHSWTIRNDPNHGTVIIETTGSTFKNYYGVSLTGERAQTFADQVGFFQNAWPRLNLPNQDTAEP